MLGLWLQFLSFLAATNASLAPFVDLLWLLDGWLVVFFEQGFDKDDTLQAVPELLVNAMAHLSLMVTHCQRPNANR